MQKNVTGQKYTVFAFDVTTNLPVTGLTDITADLSKDDSAFAPTDDTNPTETQGGKYNFDLTQGESNTNKLIIDAVSSTPDVQVIGMPGTIFTSPVGFPDNVMVGTNGANTVVPDEAGVVPTAEENRQEMDSNSNKLAAIVSDTDDLQGNQGDWLTATTVTVSDKTGFSLSTAGIAAIWNALVSGMSTIGSIGKLIIDNLNATIASRATEATVDSVKTQTDKLDNMIIEDVGGNKFTVPALENAPNISGGDATADNQETIIKLARADSEINDDNPAQHQRIVKEEGTATILATKDLFRPDGTPVTSIDHIIAKEVKAT